MTNANTFRFRFRIFSGSSVPFFARGWPCMLGALFRLPQTTVETRRTRENAEWRQEPCQVPDLAMKPFQYRASTLHSVGAALRRGLQAGNSSTLHDLSECFVQSAFSVTDTCGGSGWAHARRTPPSTSTSATTICACQSPGGLKSGSKKQSQMCIAVIQQQQGSRYWRQRCCGRRGNRRTTADTDIKSHLLEAAERRQDGATCEAQRGKLSLRLLRHDRSGQRQMPDGRGAMHVLGGANPVFLETQTKQRHCWQ